MSYDTKQNLVLWLKIIAWFAFLAATVFISNRINNTPLYETENTNLHQVSTWSEGTSDVLIGNKDIQVYARSTGSNFAIYDQNKKLVCTGTPTEFSPGEEEQPFECNFQMISGSVYDIEGYADLYTMAPETVTYQVSRVGSFIILALSMIFLVISIVVFFVWLFS